MSKEYSPDSTDIQGREGKDCTISLADKTLNKDSVPRRYEDNSLKYEGECNPKDKGEIKSEEFSSGSTDDQRREAKEYLNYLAEEAICEDEIIERYEASSPKYEEVQLFKSVLTATENIILVKDKNMIVINYNGPKETAVTLAQLFPCYRETVYILDIAAGTGLCATEFRKLGFRHMDAFDPARHMLNEAMKRDLYDRYICDMLGENSLDMPDNTYDAVTICGMSKEIMTKLQAKALAEVIRVTKAGGYVVNTSFHTTFDISNSQSEDFRKVIKNFETQEKWRQTELREFPGYINGCNGAVSVHQVL